MMVEVRGKSFDVSDERSQRLSQVENQNESRAVACQNLKSHTLSVLLPQYPHKISRDHY
jgi:hypothetical protein